MKKRSWQRRRISIMYVPWLLFIFSALFLGPLEKLRKNGPNFFLSELHYANCLLNGLIITVNQPVNLSFGQENWLIKRLYLKFCYSKFFHLFSKKNQKKLRNCLTLFLNSTLLINNSWYNMGLVSSSNTNASKLLNSQSCHNNDSLEP